MPIPGKALRSPAGPMEPLVASSAATVLRPATGEIHAELSALLRQGRLVIGDILQASADGAVLLAIGRHRVPARTDVRLDPGGPFLFRVEEGEDGVLLRVLERARPDEPGLLRALRAVVGHDRPLAQVLGELAEAVRRALAREAPPGTTRSAGNATPRNAGDLPTGSPRNAGEALRDAPRPALLRGLLDALAARVAPRNATGAELAALLSSSGQTYEARVLAAARGGAGPEPAAALRGDLKAVLLGALAELPEGEVRDALARAAAGIEAEQLLNVARDRAGEPLVWSLVLPDAGGWTTLRLVVPRRGDGEEEGAGEDGEGGFRLVLGVSFRHTGPIRIDLVGGPRTLTVGLSVTRDDVFERLAAEADEVAARLSRDGRAAQVLVRRAAPDEVEVGERPLDTRFLREHRLLDVSG